MSDAAKEEMMAYLAVRYPDFLMVNEIFQAVEEHSTFTALPIELIGDFMYMTLDKTAVLKRFEEVLDKLVASVNNEMLMINKVNRYKEERRKGPMIVGVPCRPRVTKGGVYVAPPGKEKA